MKLFRALPVFSVFFDGFLRTFLGLWLYLFDEGFCVLGLYLFLFVFFDGF